MGSADTDRMYMCIDLKSFTRLWSVPIWGWIRLRRLWWWPMGLVAKGYYIGHFTGLKKLGVKNRSRLLRSSAHWVFDGEAAYEAVYAGVAEIWGFAKYVAPEDVHVYSIDEYFIDITPYLPLYKKTPRELAQMLLDAVLEATKIYATVGIGTNLFLPRLLSISLANMHLIL